MGADNAQEGGVGIQARLDLSKKIVPTHEVAEEKFEGVPFWVRYGDLSQEAEAITRRLVAEEPQVWTDEGQESNIRLKRAFHDSLGVQQVVFVFCDDLLNQVYELPWWETWRNELQPVFERLGIERKQVVRCLLANLPAGTVIPVHHDTGYWALESHRVHVPLITSEQNGDGADQVVFEVGHSESAMRRAAFEVGQAVELNNRAKHHVRNNWHRSRVHMIFDYVEPELAAKLPRVSLEAGQKVFQTRRAIFLEEPEGFGEPEIELSKEQRLERSRACLALVKSEDRMDVKRFQLLTRRYVDGERGCDAFFADLCSAMGSRERLVELFDAIELPILISDSERRLALEKRYREFLQGPRLFMILGVMKCGTTSLFDYATQHPQIANALQKEPHFFDWRWKAVTKHTLGAAQRAAAEELLGVPRLGVDRELMLKFMQLFEPGKLLMDPVVRVAGEATPSYILGGRELAERVRTVCGPDVRFVVTLRDPVKRAYSHYQMTADPSGTPDQKKRRGTVSGRSFRSLIEEDLAALRAIGADSASIDPEVLEREYLSKAPAGHGSHSYVGRGLYAAQLVQWFKVFPREQFLFLRLEDLARDVDGTMARFFAHLDLPPMPVPDPAPKNARSYEPMGADVEAALREFYAPHNAALAALLGPDFDFNKQ